MTVIGRAFVLLGLIVIGWHGWGTWQRLAAHAGWESAAGRVVAMHEDSRRNDDGSSSVAWVPEVRFAPSAGAEVAIRVGVAQDPPAYAAGDPVTVRFPAGRPEEAVIDGFKERWWKLIFYGSLGAFCVAYGVVVWLIGWRLRQQAANLRRNGRPVRAEVIGVDCVEAGRRRKRWRVSCRWRDETGRSRMLGRLTWVDPHPHITGGAIIVLVDPADPRNFDLAINVAGGRGPRGVPAAARSAARS